MDDLIDEFAGVITAIMMFFVIIGLFLKVFIGV